MYLTPGAVYVVEHKTSSADITPGAPYWKRLRLDAQVSNYQVGVRAMGHEPAGTLYDVVGKPTLVPFKATPVEKREYTKPRDKSCPECKKKAPSYPAPHVFDVETNALIESTRNGVVCVDGRIVTDPGGKLYANLRERDETVEEYRMRLRLDIGTNPDDYYQRGVVVRLAEEELDAAYDTWTTARQLRESELSERWPRNVDACDQYGSFCEYFDVCSGAASIADPIRFRDAEEHEELTPATTAKKRLPLVTTSSLKCFRSCPRKYFHRYVQRRRPLASTAALRFGTLVHVGLEVWWRTGDVYAAVDAMRAKGEPDPFELVKAEELLLGYHVRWIDERLEVLAVEEEFVAALINPQTQAESRTYQRGGKIDALVRIQGAA